MMDSQSKWSLFFLSKRMLLFLFPEQIGFGNSFFLVGVGMFTSWSHMFYCKWRFWIVLTSLRCCDRQISEPSTATVGGFNMFQLFVSQTWENDERNLTTAYPSWNKHSPWKLVLGRRLFPGKGPGLFPVAILVLGSVFFQNWCLKPANVGDTHIQV